MGFEKNEEIQENKDFFNSDDDEGHPIINRDEEPDFSLSDYEELEFEKESDEEETCNYRLKTT